MGSFIRTVRYKSMDIRELLYYLVVNIVKGDTVMYIARGDFYGQNNTVDIAGSMGFIGQLLLVVALHKQTAVGVSGADSNGLLRFLLAFL